MIENITLEQFRSWDSRTFNFAPKTLLVGNNGVGKTNILEAVSMLSLTTSWRVERDSEVVGWPFEYARVRSGEMELFIQKNPYLKKFRINGVAQKTQAVIGQFPTVLFQPDDILLLYGAPSLRRSYLDRVISQTSVNYTLAVLELNKLLKQRNRLLKNISEGLSSEDELVFWDDELDRIRTTIIDGRGIFLQFLNDRLPLLFRELVPENGDIDVHYIKSPNHISGTFQEHLRLNRSKEIINGTSLYGPHREDFSIHWGSHEARSGMSRGQSRSFLFALKLAELAFITEHNKTKPVLLLDDIFSELDIHRRSKLLQLFEDYQVIMTATDAETVELGKIDAEVINI